MSAQAAPARSRRQPWWIPPVFGRVPDEMEDRHVGLIGVIALALLFESYDISMLGSALKHIRESFGLTSAEVGSLVAQVRLGALPAFVLIPFADRIGRRRLFLACLVGMSVATVATAFSQSAAQFIGFQIVTRTFLVAGSAMAFVIVTEEMPARSRGWAIGILGALGATGFGLGALIFAFVDWLPFGWRALYVFGATPLVLLPMFRRRVLETRRFQIHQQSQREHLQDRGWWRPFVGLLRDHPGRTTAIILIGSLSAGGHAPAMQLLADFVQTEHAWQPYHYSSMVIIGGLVGILGNTVAGRLADRLGRRWVGFALLAGFPFIAAGVYQGPSWTIPILWIPLVFLVTGGSTILRALTAELFPTSSRGTATGLLMVLETAGAAFTLHLVSIFTLREDSVAPAISVIVFLCLLAGFVALLLPETANRELETISGAGAD